MLPGVPFTEKFQIARIVQILDEINGVAAFIGAGLREENIKLRDKIILEALLYIKL